MSVVIFKVRGNTHYEFIILLLPYMHLQILTWSCNCMPLM